MQKYFITNRNLIESDKYIDHVTKTSFDADYIIFREKDLSESEADLLLGELIKHMSPKKIIVNKFIKLAKKYSCLGVHLSFADYINNKSIVTDDLILGVSIHSSHEAMILKKHDNVDYIMFGHVFKSECKKGIEPRGLKQLEDVINIFPREVVAVGGIDAEKFSDLISLGVDSVGIMSGYYR